MKYRIPVRTRPAIIVPHSESNGFMDALLFGVVIGMPQA
jgi:hypothetical protein